jgi:phosphate transport system substrate-binding protein
MRYLQLNKSIGVVRTALTAVALAVSASAAQAEIKVSGSDTLEAFTQNALSQFNRSQGGNVPIAASFKGTAAGLRDLCEGKVGIAPASARMDAEQARKCGIPYLELPIAFDAIAVIAHPAKAALGELSMAELKTIFHPDNAGKVTRWSQVRVGSGDAPMTVVSLDTKSGTNAFFGAKVHGLRGFVRPDAKAVADNTEVIRLVAADPNAIGFVSLAALVESKAAVWRVPLNFGGGPVVPS